MAIDSRNKRFSIMGLLQPVPSVFPNPDGAVDTQDRAQYATLYPGIALAAPVAVIAVNARFFINSIGRMGLR